jgi:hypothetical protein
MVKRTCSVLFIKSSFPLRKIRVPSIQMGAIARTIRLDHILASSRGLRPSRSRYRRVNLTTFHLRYTR